MRTLNPTLTHHNGRSQLLLERRFAHSPAKVWRALTEPAQLNQWFPFDVEIELRLGGKVHFIEKGAKEPSSDGEITELDPPRLLAFTWYGDLLRWELQPDGDGCRLIFTHTFADRAGAASFAAGWQVCLSAMADVLDRKPVDEAAYTGPEWRRQMAELHEAYADALGLSAGSVETTADGWQVRFERQLIKPIDEVWARLTGDSTPSAGSAPPKEVTTQAVQAGPVTAVESPTLLEYEWQVAGRPAGRVRWELAQGTGHGARLILAQTGSHESVGHQATALAAWEHHIEQVAKGLIE
ncbi:MAG: toxin-antitoxin system toxin subunit [Chloroflexi bacterium]|nr:MAG: toxin-antitoxin system toxin subunit [Chloroflexota bacterium]